MWIRLMKVNRQDIKSNSGQISVATESIQKFKSAYNV